MKYLLLVLAWVGCYGVRAQNAAPAFVADSLDAYITKGLAEWNIPGLAIAIVKDGQVVMSKGYGVSDVQTQTPVDENTLFMIASNTKLFTGTALAQLEYYKKLSLDDKVTKYRKDFMLYDKTSAGLVTITDLLSHRLGTKTFQGDFTFWNSNISRQQIIQKMRLLKPTGNFRQQFGYCNSCYLTAGEMIPLVTRQPWEVYVYDSLLMPVGMTNTHMLVQGMDQRRNAAKGYTNAYTGTLGEVPYDQVDNIGPAGSMVSNVKDLGKWLMLQLDSGRVKGKQVIPWPVLQRTRDINIVINSRKSRVYPSHINGYGLGLFVSDYNGRQVYHHTGGAFGFVSNTCFVPEEKLGITILTNNDNQNFFEALRYQILDAYLGVAYTNRSTRQKPGFDKAQQNIWQEVAALKKQVKGNTPPLSLATYAGTYYHELYGNIIITTQGNDLSIAFKGHNKLTGKLQYMQKDNWLLSYNHQGYGVFATKFTTDNGKVLSVDIQASDFLEADPYTFIKK